MPTINYSFEMVDPKKTSLAMLRDVDISKKHAVEIFNHIRGKPVSKAEKILESAIKLEQPIPFKRHKRWLPHRKGEGWKTGRYPQKAAKQILALLKNAEANADFKGLSKEKLKIVHACANKSMILPRLRSKGRWKRSDIELVNLEIAVREC